MSVDPRWRSDARLATYRQQIVLTGAFVLGVFLILAVIAIVAVRILNTVQMAAQCNLERQAEQAIRGRIQSLELGRGQGTVVSLPPQLEPDVIPKKLVDSCAPFLSGKRVNPAELQRELPLGGLSTLPPAVIGPDATTSTTVKHAAPKKATTKKPVVKKTTTSTKPRSTTSSVLFRPSPTTSTTSCVIPTLPAICGGVPVNE